jgi:hypothetical protein
MRLWLIGGAPAVKVVIILKWAKTGINAVKGYAEVYVRDDAGVPTKRQTVVSDVLQHVSLLAESEFD